MIYLKKKREFFLFYNIIFDENLKYLIIIICVKATVFPPTSNINTHIFYPLPFIPVQVFF
jgi:hypothetical protein